MVISKTFCQDNSICFPKINETQKFTTYLYLHIVPYIILPAKTQNNIKL